MSHTVKNTRFWFRHDSAKDRRYLNKGFRLQEHEVLQKIRGIPAKVQIPGVGRLGNPGSLRIFQPNVDYSCRP